MKANKLGNLEKNANSYKPNSDPSLGSNIVDKIMDLKQNKMDKKNLKQTRTWTRVKLSMSHLIWFNNK